MAIQIKKDPAGLNAKVNGIDVSPIPLNSYLCSVTVSDGGITIFNPDAPNENGDPTKVMSNVPFTEFIKSDGTTPVDAADLKADIDAQLLQTPPTDVAAGYKGLFKADNNIPDLSTDIADYNNGDWFFVTTLGTVDLGAGDVDLKINDQVKLSIVYDTDGVTELSRSWNVIEDQSVKVSDIESSSLDQFDIHVDSSYTGSIITGSSLQPYTDLTTAITNSAAGNSILIKGVHIISAEIVLPHSLSFYGTEGAEIKYANYDTTNGDIFSFDGSNSEKFIFKNITFKNAGGYGLLIKKTSVVELRNCKFYNNGWNGTGLHTALPSATSGVLGYDSSSSELQAFYAGSNASNGGAVRLQECTKPLIRECRAENNLRGFRIQDCGINGGGFVIENQSLNNIESGIYIAAGSLGGCQNITVTINYSSYNANNGLLCIGGINNKFSQNEVNGNWNAGFCAWGASNVTLRDSGLYDNNRSQYNGIGNTGDAKASIQINDAYSFIPTQIAYNPAFRFIAEILDTQIHYTGLGSNSEKIGFLMTSGMGLIPDNAKNIIKIDDVGFIGQDYAIDLSEVDISNLRLSLGDNSYQSIGQKAVKAPLAGNYSELPFSNHVMEVPEVDVVVDTLKQTIALHEGVGGNVINTYKVNELATDLKTSSVDIIQKSSDKIQLRDLTFGNIYINGVVAGNNLNSANDSLNAAFGMDLVDYKDFLVSEVGINGDESSGGSLPAIANNWYISYGSQAGTQINQSTIGNNYRNYNPFYNGEALEKGHEFIWTLNPTIDFIIGLWGAAEGNYAGVDALAASNWSQGFFLNGNAGAQPTSWSQSQSSGVTITANGSVSGEYAMPNGQAALRFGQDGYLYLFEIVGGGYTLIGKSNTTIAGTSVMIQFAGFNQVSFPVMTERTETWEIVHDYDSSQNGEWSNGLEESTIIKSRVSVNPGEKLTLNFDHFGRFETIGFGYTGAATGQLNAQDLITSQLFYNSAELIRAVDGNANGTTWTWNTDATYYYDPNGDGSNVGYWNNNGVGNLGLISFRYNDNNVVKMFHETNGELIATLVAPRDGSAFNVYLGSNENNHTADRIPQLLKYTMVDNEGNPSNVTGWYYIESPDGEFYYPLFATEEEADHIDTVENGSGTSHIHTFADDTYNGGGNTWYMPTTNSVHSGTQAPQHGIYGNSTNVLWNEIPTDDDSNYLPTFNNITYNVQEGSSINIQYKAQGMTDTFNVTNVPNGYADNGSAIIGTAEDITNGYGQSVTHVLNVTKANNFGSVQGTITINVKANLAGNEFTLVDQSGSIKFTQDGGATVLDFNTVTFNAGSTYKFYLDGDTLQTSDIVDIADANGNGITGNDGLTQFGSGPGYAGAYLQYAIPSDVAPGVKLQFWNAGLYYSFAPLTIAGSSYSEAVTGITNEGPATANGSIVNADNWYSIDETLSAGERVILNGSFFSEVFAELGNNTAMWFGIKDGAWVNTLDGGSPSGVYNQGFEYDLAIKFYKQNWQGGSIRVMQNGNGQGNNIGFANGGESTLGAFIEITNSGDNIRMGVTANTSVDNSTTTTYANWAAAKAQTGDQGYGLSTVDVMAFYDRGSSSADFDVANIDWTLLSEVSVPTAPTNNTSWTKALDFSGSNEHLKQVSSNNQVNAIRMGGYSQQVANNSNYQKNSDTGYSFPWSTAIVFESDFNSSNQHIWNQGEGAGSNDDNIYLRTDANGILYFGWGRGGNNNECRLSGQAITGWRGVYVGFKGGRFSASNATASNLANAFDIRLFNEVSGWVFPGNSSTSANWINTGNRTDRSIGGDFTIGGRGSNRNFHGKVASMVVTTLKRGVMAPDATEIEMMITDPIKWVTNYKVGETYRYPNTTSNYSNFQVGDTQPAQATQVWLMGDGASDSYSNGIRNYIQTADQNWSKLQLNSMVSNDIQNVTILGLS